jgi:DNA-binding LytR/AlgR family response regulator
LYKSNIGQRIMITTTTSNASCLAQGKPPLATGPGRVGEIPTGFIFLRYGNRYVKVGLGEIRYVESRKNYCRVVTADRVYMVLARLLDFIEALPSPAFCQVHRSFVVALSQVASFDTTNITVAGEKLPIGGHYRFTLLSAAPVLNPLMRQRRS